VNAPFPFEKAELRHETGWLGRRSIAAIEKKIPGKKKPGREKGILTVGLPVFRQFRLFPLH